MSVSADAIPERLDVNEEFLRLGWCPHQINKLHRAHTSNVLAFLSAQDRRNYRPNNHTACAASPRCVANNVNLKNYDTAHTPACSGLCQYFGVDYTAIVSIIRAGGVPLISTHVDPASSPERPVMELQVTARTDSSRYTALSHVWFDGLGNPSANALPACQLLSVSSQLKAQPQDHQSGVVSIGPLQVDWPRQSFILYPEKHPPLFWMDTLCIPVGDAEREVRLMAINQMASIYAAAVQVLVLDAELMKCELAKLTATEALARMACSAWMTRSWTLQEGVLARECVFQFKDRAIDPVHEWCHHGPRFWNRNKKPTDVFPDADDSLGWEVYKEIYDRFWDTLHHDCKTKYRRDPPDAKTYQANGGAKFSFGGFRGSQAVGKVHTLPAVQGLTTRGKSGLDDKDHFTLDPGEDRRLKPFVDTWNELAHRSTTMPEDLHVIIANLLDFNADTIMELPSRAERMRAIILSFKLLPVSLFWNTGSRWGDKDTTYDGCNRWIPIEPSKSSMTITPVMEVTEEWLKLDFDYGLDAGASKAQVLLVRSTVGSTKTYRMIRDPRDGSMYEMVLSEIENQGALNKSEELYIIVESPFPLAPNSPTRGALFIRHPSSVDTDGHELRLIYRFPIALQLMADNDETAPPIAILPSHTTVLVEYGK